ncbi:MAG: 50S ribosomal protein L4, partial [Nitrospinota bacterium]
MDIEIINTDKQEVGRRELDSSLFQAKVRGDLLHTCVVAHLASIWRGPSSVQDRSMVRGRGKKLWGQ